MVIEKYEIKNFIRYLELDIRNSVSSPWGHGGGVVLTCIPAPFKALKTIYFRTFISIFNVISNQKPKFRFKPI